MVNVQREITLRAIELLLLPPDQTSFILDVGCGSGLSGQVLEEQGHVWVGCDVSRDMLGVARERMDASMEENNNNNKDETMNVDNDDSNNSDDDDEVPSTGDLMHHVSLFVRGAACCVPSFRCVCVPADDQFQLSFSCVHHLKGYGYWIALSTGNL
jgi:SAM-dependent methyltransferase